MAGADAVTIRCSVRVGATERVKVFENRERRGRFRYVGGVVVNGR